MLFMRFSDNLYKELSKFVSLMYTNVVFDDTDSFEDLNSLN